ncbi:MAG TPA: L-2-hydroxyglutarate oxidase, partial [Acidimicrobiia bacterium]|nr:L-2-hydroxyglutarate oxidase [Acidimicrobiia bacterium]
EHGIHHEVTGKVIVAVDEVERERLRELERRCASNGVRAEVIGRERLRELEPHVAGIAALHVLDTGIVDYGDVCRALAAEIEEKGAIIRRGCTASTGNDGASGFVVETNAGPIEAQRVVTCAGLYADTVAEALSGPAGTAGMRVMAFRGEYREFIAPRAHLVRGLVYPVPDPQYPFLGVHLTRGIDGHVHAGPNAVLAFAREGYEWRIVDAHHLRQTFSYPGFRRFARKNWRFGLGEMARSASARRFTKAVRRLVPEVERADLEIAPAGVRAQAIKPDGNLVEDFAIHHVGRALHVLNAPSPAATASLEIGATIAARLDL